MNKHEALGLAAALGGAVFLAGCVGAEAVPPGGGDASAPLDATTGDSSDATDVTNTPETAPPPADAPLDSLPPPPATGFTLTLTATRLNIVRGSSAQVALTVTPAAGFAGQVTITVSGLPAGVTADSLVIPAGATSGSLTLHAASTATLTVDGQLSISGASGTTTAPSLALPLVVQDPSGTLDVTFGVNGIETVPIFALTPNGSLSGIVVQPDGKVVFTGVGYTAGTNELVLGRLNVDGTPDGTFNPGGSEPGVLVQLPAGLQNFVPQAGVQLLPSGEIAVAGFFNVAGQNHAMFAAEYTPTGAAKTSFGSSGLVQLWDNNIDAKPSGFVMQPDGKLVLGGFFGNPNPAVPAIVRLLANGAADPAFDPPATGDAGVGFDLLAYQSAAIGPIGLLKNGDILAAVNGIPTAFALAIGPNGKVDPAFAASGALAPVTSFTGGAAALAIGADGSAVFVGSTATSIELTRFNALGQLDVSFGTQGYAAPTVSPNGNASASSMVLTPDGKIVVGATLPGSSSIGVVRYTTAGALDTTFAQSGYAGVAQTDGSTTAGGTQVALDGAGRIVFGTMIEVPANTHDAGVYGNPAVQIARFWP